MRILITGGKGMLARALVRRLEGRHEILALSHDELDIADAPSVLSRVEAARPDGILHCAAWTDVDGCELDPGRAFRVNAWGCRNVAASAVRIGAEVVYFSSDYVFDGQAREPYREHDPRNPANTYGRSKAFGEDALSSICPRHYVVRTSALFGLGGRSFPALILRQARAGGALEVVSDQVVAPTYVGHAAEGVAHLLGSGLYGVYHLTSSGETDWYAFAGRILSLAGLGHVPLRPIHGEESGRAARRPRYSVLDTSNFRETFGWRPPSWEDGLREFLAESGAV